MARKFTKSLSFAHHSWFSSTHDRLWYSTLTHPHCHLSHPADLPGHQHAGGCAARSPRVHEETLQGLGCLIPSSLCIIVRHLAPSVFGWNLSRPLLLGGEQSRWGRSCRRGFIEDRVPVRLGINCSPLNYPLGRY